MVPSKEGLYTQAVMLKWLTPKSNVIGKYLHHCNELNEYARVTRYRLCCPVYVILPHPPTQQAGTGNTVPCICNTTPPTQQAGTGNTVLYM